MGYDGVELELPQPTVARNRYYVKHFIDWYRGWPGLTSIHRGWLPCVSLDGDGDGEADAEDVDDHADDHHLERKGIFGGGRERHNDALHEEVDGHAVQSTRKDGVLHKERHRAAQRKVDRSGRKRDQEVTEKAEDRGRGSAGEGARPQQSAGNPLEQANRLKSEETIDDERSGNVQDAADEAAP